MKSGVLFLVFQVGLALRVPGTGHGEQYAQSSSHYPSPPTEQAQQHFGHGHYQQECDSHQQNYQEKPHQQPYNGQTHQQSFNGQLPQQSLNGQLHQHYHGQPLQQPFNGQPHGSFPEPHQQHFNGQPHQFNGGHDHKQEFFSGHAGHTPGQAHTTEGHFKSYQAPPASFPNHQGPPPQGQFSGQSQAFHQQCHTPPHHDSLQFNSGFHSPSLQGPHHQGYQQSQQYQYHPQFLHDQHKNSHFGRKQNEIPANFLHEGFPQFYNEMHAYQQDYGNYNRRKQPNKTSRQHSSEL